MELCTLFYQKKNRELRKIERLIENKNITCHFQDVTENGVASYLYHDMQITTLPALYLFANNKYRIFEGTGKIEAYLAKP